MTQHTTLDLARSAAEINAHLDGGIIPFWSARALDRQCGGYLTNFDSRGLALDTPEKYLNTQCRLLWWFSTLQRHRPEVAGSAELAGAGLDFLLRHFWDHGHGGWFWKVHRNGERLDDGKIVYGQSFAIYALAEHYLATRDARALDYACRTFDLLKVQACDARHGGFLENLNVDWTPEGPGFAGGDRKSLDTHMHLMESFTVLVQASGAPAHRRALAQVIDLICDRMIDADSGCGLNQFDLAWRSVPAMAIKRTWNAERFGEQPAQPTQTTSYGHNVELAWLLRRAADVAAADPARSLAIIRRLLSHAIAHGLDRTHGGVYRDGLRTSGEPIVLEKEFWQNAEVLVGFLDGYELLGDESCLEAFQNVWHFVRDHMIVPGVGEWRTLLAADGSILDGNIGNPWKVSYHTGRAMLECSQRLARLMGPRGHRPSPPR
jgi:mannobiose 2-epimerase